MNDIFLDNFSTLTVPNGKHEILSIIAKDIIGAEMFDKLLLRYDDMKRNYENVTRDALPYFPDSKEWEFSDGVMPYGRNPDGSYYSDTSSVPIPITHKLFKRLRSEFITSVKNNKSTIDGAVIALDLPIWFNLSAANRIMIIAQDPLRNPKWYYECEDAICSSPFGMHSREHRNKGGKRFDLLTKTLTGSGCGVYLTDAYKYYLCGYNKSEEKKIKCPLTKDSQILEAYKRILLKEIGIIQPTIIVTLGREAKQALNSILGNVEKNIVVLHLPHFSGAAQWVLSRSETYQNLKRELSLRDNSIYSQAKVYSYAILNKIPL